MENIVRKGEIACNKRFLLFLQCFLSYMALTFNSKCILKCRLQFVSIWTSLTFYHLVVGEKTIEIKENAGDHCFYLPSRQKQWKYWELFFLRTRMYEKHLIVNRFERIHCHISDLPKWNLMTPKNLNSFVKPTSLNIL